MHELIVCRVLATTINLFMYRDVAKILRVHARESVLEILKNAIPEMTDKALHKSLYLTLAEMKLRRCITTS